MQCQALRPVAACQRLRQSNCHIVVRLLSIWDVRAGDSRPLCVQVPC